MDGRIIISINDVYHYELSIDVRPWSNEPTIYPRFHSTSDVMFDDVQ